MRYTVGRFALLFVAISSAILPLHVQAAVRVSEIMYDLEGTDSGREWIEVKNEGTTAVDIAEFRIFEGNTNHKLTAISGGTTLEAGGIAVIADDAAKFVLDWPGFAGILFDTAFTSGLSNTGETIAVRNGELVDEDSVSYSSDMGAAGDGKSLGRAASTLAPQTPSPGTAASSPASSNSASTANVSTSASSTAATSAQSVVAVDIPSIKIDAGDDRTVIVGADIVLDSIVYGVEGKPIENARVVWNFGEGSSREGKSVSFVYRHPGRYAVSASASLGVYAGADRFVVTASPAALSVRIETDGSVAVLNKERRDLDISYWQVDRAGVRFRFPKDTVILAGEGVRLPPTTTGLPTYGPARLLYPSGEEVAVSTPALERIPESELVNEERSASTTASTTSPIGATSTPLDAPSAPVQAESGTEVPALKSSQAAALALSAVAEADPAQSKNTALLWLLGAVGIGLLGAGAVYVARLPRAIQGSSENGDQSAVRAADKEAEDYTILERP